MPMEKTFDAASAEARLYQMWEEAGAFAAGAGAEDGAETFSIMIPPPNVTGSLHMGHAFNNTLQDILVRWHRMRGFDTLWQPGTDHAGIATQMVTEREMAANGEKSRTEMGREDFEKRVWQQKIKSRGTIIGQLKRLGASCDWSREAFTMSGAPNAPEGEDGNFHDAVIKVFVEMYEKGLIYRGKRLVNWDPHFETAISDLEVENIEVDGHMWHFQYPLQDGETYEYVEKDEDGNVLFTETRDYISIATTRPETMLGDGAVAVHPSDERYAPIVGKLCEIPVGPKEHRRMIPIITDEYPDPDFGSGAVKITGAHDFNDYEVAKRGRIPMYRLMDTKGAMRSDGAPYAEAAEIAGAVARDERDLSVAEADMVNLVPDALRGLDRFEARKQVIEQITSEGLAVMVPATDPRLGKGAASAGKAATGEAPTDASEGGEPRTDADQLVPLVEPKKVMQPFGDRSKVVIEPMLTDQWFVDTDKIVGPAIDAVRNGEVRILPERDEKVYFHWLENIEPWCISRQLWWGHRIPVWYGVQIKSRNSTTSFLDLTKLVDAEGKEIGRQPKSWKSFCGPSWENILEEAREYYYPHNVIEVADKDEFDAVLNNMIFERRGPDSKYPYPVLRDPDVLDTWFSSGLWPIGTLGWPEDTPELQKYFPTSTLVTGFDIIFFWVARMMMMQYAVMGERPFDTVYVHALVRDEKGKKMSKSLGNVLDPLELIDDYGADAVRFTLTAMAAMGRDLKLSTSRIAGYRNFTTKLWNAVRFAEMNEVFENRGQGLPDAPKETVNRWIIGETAKVREEVDAALEAFRFNDAANALYAYVWGKVCDWYVEFSKPLLMDGTDAQKTESQATMAWVLDQCVTLLHPIMPFITEELWSLMAERDGPLVLADWPTYDTALVDPEAEAEMSWAIAMIDGVRSARAQMNVPAGLQVPVIRLESSDAARTAWDRNEAMIKRLARIDGLTDAEAAPKGSLAVSTPGASFALPLADIIDVDKEKARLGKSLEKLGKELGGLRGRLKNPKFVESAPEEVVQEAKANLAAREEEEAQLNAALERLAEIG